MHTNIIRFCDRRPVPGGPPFHNVDDMDVFLIANWNDVVGPDDVVYHLGDFAIGPNGRVGEILKCLNGRIRLCEGSHDKSVLAKGNRELLDAVADSYFLKFFDDEGERVHSIYLSHYCHRVWPASHYGAWHFFGHSHSRLDAYAAAEGKLLDVGVDGHEYRPWTLAEVVEVMASRPLNFNDLRRRGQEAEDE